MTSSSAAVVMWSSERTARATAACSGEDDRGRGEMIVDDGVHSKISLTEYAMLRRTDDCTSAIGAPYEAAGTSVRRTSLPALRRAKTARVCALSCGFGPRLIRSGAVQREVSVKSATIREHAVLGAVGVGDALLHVPPRARTSIQIRPGRIHLDGVC